MLSFGYELISETDRLREFPELGRVVPKYRNDDIREIVFVRIELCTESITIKSSATSPAFGIQPVEFRNYRSCGPK